MSNINLKHIAKELKLSVSTVSKALRDSYEIGKTTKEKVIAFAKEKNYQPNPFASGLRRNKSKTVAVVIPEIANNFFSLVINGIESVAQERDYHVLIYLTHEDFAKEQNIIKHLQGGRVDGILMSLSINSVDHSHLAEITHKGIPIVFFDRICHEIETAKITTDDFVSGLNATEHLIKKGCQDIAFLSLSENLSIDNKRKQGYLEALNKHDLPQNSRRIISCNNDDADNFKKIKTLLKSSKKPDGIFASVEKLAITTYEVCRELNIRIPKDLKIICFSNLATASLLSPSLSTITQPAYEIGKQAASVLFKYLDKNKTYIPNENIVLKSSLFARESTAAK
jgi:LacI family transcriptional regulator